MNFNSRNLLFTIVAAYILSTGCNSVPPDQRKPAAMATATGMKPDSPASAQPAVSENQKKWSTEQILTCTFSQCWEISGKDEDSFFDIVQALAVISANDRGLTLPATEDAGRKAGEYMKSQAKLDNQQLLCAVVDAAVRKAGIPASTK